MALRKSEMQMNTIEEVAGGPEARRRVAVKIDGWGVEAEDIVFIEARDTEVFYTGGLLPSGEYPLPRDYDLDVVEAVVQIGGPLVNGGINANNLSGGLIAPGIGSPSPRLLTVLRPSPKGGRMPIIVDLHKALVDPTENLLLVPGDVLILQESPKQAIARYFSQVVNLSIFSEVFARGSTSGTATVSVP